MKKRSAGFQKRLDELKGIGIADLDDETFEECFQFIEEQAEKRLGVRVEQKPKLSFEESLKILDNVEGTDLSEEKVARLIKVVDSYSSPSPKQQKPKSLCNEVWNKIQSALDWMGRKL